MLSAGASAVCLPQLAHTLSAGIGRTHMPPAPAMSHLLPCSPPPPSLQVQTEGLRQQHSMERAELAEELERHKALLAEAAMQVGALVTRLHD